MRPQDRASAGFSGQDRRDRLRVAIGGWCLEVACFEEALAAALRSRWGSFAAARGTNAPAGALLLLERAHRAEVLGGWGEGGHYRIEARRDGEALEVLSHHFRLRRSPGEEGLWRLRLLAQEQEPAERIVENALRYVVAHLAWQEGGLALHAAGVVRGSAAYVFAGPSRSGKTTLVGLSRPCTSLGDDFAVLLPAGRGAWRTTAVPFDNSERAPDAEPGAFFPVRGLWRIFPAARHRLERLEPLRAAASLLGCVTFAGALPGFEGALAERVERVARETGFAHLHFARDPGFWEWLAGD